MTDDQQSRLRHYAHAAWPGIDWGGAEIRVGAFHTVVIPPAGPILRLTTGSGFESRAQREAKTLRTMARIALPVPIPEVLDGPVVGDGWSATLITRVPGAQTDDVTTANSGRLQGYADLLAALHAAEPGAVRELPPPRTWCGGREWLAIVRHDLAPLLDGDVRTSAVQRVEQLLDSEDAGADTVCHGDFGPHNILWIDDCPAGLIDLDHACLGDPAIDLAPLIGFHGLKAISALGTPQTLRRAMIHRATLSLQVAAAAHLSGSLALRDHALRNFAGRCRDGTLFDPDGLTPQQLPATGVGIPFA